MRERWLWFGALVVAAVAVFAGVRWAWTENRLGGAASPPQTPAQVGVGVWPSEASAEPPGDDPQRFARSTFAQGLAQPTAMAFGRDGALYVTELVGRVTVLRDTDGDGRADQASVFADGLTDPLGVAVLRPGEIVVSQRGRITRLRDTNGDGAADERQDIVTGLPVGRHQNDNVVVGPDGRLYWGQGSRSDHGESGVVPYEASILSANVDGSDLKVVATGLRNPYGLAFDAKTGALYATDNGRDVPDKGVPDELNLIEAGGDYGWPDCWGAGEGTHCEGTKLPLLLLPPHSSADGLAVYRGEAFPGEYQGAVFIALWGANDGDPNVGRQVVVALPPKEAGRPWTVAPFATGFIHPLAVAVGPDGALYVADMGRNEIVRFAPPAASR
ncbi:MAG: PQQ-dependent sugar dehydrogenase [Firmicutes bacterium]|nr:PQQ-dependent sugar dehydrogenase [Bacillota bacterium]MBE3590462.1 PQQ-dependent sugar dehydrogenase [Bacillota bacterium]